MNCPAIEAQNLTVRFGDYIALNDLSVTISESAFVAVLGPNGAGKSTFLRACLGLVQPIQGSLNLFGQTPEAFPAERLGYVPQIKTLDRTFPALAMELVATGISRTWPGRLRGEKKDKVFHALEQVGAGHLAARSLSRLSGGELQRIYLARGLIREPRLVLLDEPATGIDPAGEQDMFRVIESYQSKSKATILMITHDWHTAVHHASHILVLNRNAIGFGESSPELAEMLSREAFGHIGHNHPYGRHS